MPVKDGDQPNASGVVREEQEGFWCVRFISSRFNPAMNLLDGRDGDNYILGKLTEAEAYSGCSFKATGAAFFYDVSGSKGVSMGFDNLMMIEQGERLGGGGGGTGKADAAFGVTASENSAEAEFEDDPFG